jgi:G protein beta subunit-like protein
MDGYIALYSLVSGNIEQVSKIQAHSAYITKCALSSNSAFFASCSADKTAKIWGVGPEGFTQLKALIGHRSWVWDAAFTADG